jgi:hypothetical protein
MRKGDKIKILQMEDYNGTDTQATQMNGNIYTIDYIDDMGQIHLLESGLAVIPEVDKFIKVGASRFNNEISDIYDTIQDYIRFNEYIDNSDGFLLTHNGTVSLTTAQSIREEGEFFPISFLVCQTIGGYHPDVNRIEEMVSKYIDNE